ncbi:hypothetical protein TGVAND_203860 [Toxoplasma gondii VAND]|uniref:Uncharacterized protein n=1 Tax=Toxoplasma gondii VAND TaxID=933077 RepID=A0A086Q3S4_TOXGO|nr:hypothetical protein TGVAND_203860 [Toxoplasma gondii VAND]
MALNRSSPSPSVEGAVRHLMRALQQHEAAAEELKTQLDQHEAASSLLSHYLSPCFHVGPRDVAPGAPPSSPPSCSSPCSPIDSAAAAVSASPCPRIFIPLTTEALLPGCLLPSAAPPLLHLGGDYLATFRLGHASCSSTRALSSASASPPSAGRSQEAQTGKCRESSECGALGLLSRREALLREQEKVVDDKVKKLRAQLQIGQEERLRSGAGAAAFSGGPAVGKPGASSAASAGEEREQAGKKGQAHFTKDGFVEIVEEYTSDEEEPGKEEQRQRPVVAESVDSQELGSGESTAVRRLSLSPSPERGPGPAMSVSEGNEFDAYSRASVSLARSTEGAGRGGENRPTNAGHPVGSSPGGKPEPPLDAAAERSRRGSTSAGTEKLSPSPACPSTSSLSASGGGFGAERGDGEKARSACSWSPAVAERIVERSARDERGDAPEAGRLHAQVKNESSVKRGDDRSPGCSPRAENTKPEGAQPTKKVSLFKALRQHPQC